MTFKEFQAQVEASGFRAIDHGLEHWKISGGEREVSVWPHTARGLVFHAQGARRGEHGNTLRDAIQAAGKPKRAFVPPPDDLMEENNRQWEAHPLYGVGVA